MPKHSVSSAMTQVGLGLGLERGLGLGLELEQALGQGLEQGLGQGLEQGQGLGQGLDAASVERHGQYTKLRLSDKLHVWLSSGRGRWAMVVRLGDDGALHVYPDLRTAHKQLDRLHK